MNANGDFANSCAYHIDRFDLISSRNIRDCVEKTPGDKWVIVGLARSLSEAKNKAARLQYELCKIHNRTPYGISELLDAMYEKNQKIHSDQ